jgi:hypothetical protein
MHITFVSTTCKAGGLIKNKQSGAKIGFGFGVHGPGEGDLADVVSDIGKMPLTNYSLFIIVINNHEVSQQLRERG